jgi:hypothetical protein
VPIGIVICDITSASERTPGWWSDANLVRLYRSLQKLSAGLAADRFSVADWQALLGSYFATAVQLEPGVFAPAR